MSANIPVPAARHALSKTPSPPSGQSPISAASSTNLSNSRPSCAPPAHSQADTPSAAQSASAPPSCSSSTRGFLLPPDIASCCTRIRYSRRQPPPASKPSLSRCPLLNIILNHHRHRLRIAHLLPLQEKSLHLAEELQRLEGSMKRRRLSVCRLHLAPGDTR